MSIPESQISLFPVICISGNLDFGLARKTGRGITYPIIATMWCGSHIEGTSMDKKAAEAATPGEASDSVNKTLNFNVSEDFIKDF